MTTPGHVCAQTVLAGDIAVHVPAVRIDDPVAQAVRVMAVSRLPELIVVDECARPRTVLAGTAVLRLAMPTAHQDEPALASELVDRFWLELAGRTVGDCASPRPADLVTVRSDATLLEVAALMTNRHSQVVAVVDVSGVLIGAITLDRVLTALAVSSAD